MNGGAGDSCVACRGVQTAMPQQRLDDAYIGSGFHQVSRKAVTQHARVYGLEIPAALQAHVMALLTLSLV